MRATWGVLLLLLLPAGPAAAEFFRWTDEDGVVHFSSQPPAGRQATPVTVKPLNGYSAPPATAKAAAAGARPVVMYSTAWCGVCKRARAYFQQKGVTFTEYDVETSDKGRQDYRRLNGKGVPILLVGEQRLNGFSAGRFEAAYRGK